MHHTACNVRSRRPKSFPRKIRMQSPLGCSPKLRDETAMERARFAATTDDQWDRHRRGGPPKTSRSAGTVPLDDVFPPR